jgi:hypothetical protein
VLGALFSVLVLRWPRLAGIALLVVATAEFALGAGIRSPLQFVWPLFFAAGALAESARRPDGQRSFVLRVAAEIVAVPLVALLALAIVVFIQITSICGTRSGAC